MLPNLPRLGRECIDVETPVALDPAGWVLVCKADPTRWCLTLSLPAGGTALLTTLPDTAFAVGTPFGGNVPWEMKYKDYLTYCQRAFYVYGKGAGGFCNVIEAFIVKTPHPAGEE